MLRFQESPSTPLSILRTDDGRDNRMKRSYNLAVLGPLAILLAAFLWSLDALMRRFLYELPSMVIVFSEHFLGFLVTLPWLVSRWDRIKRLDQRTWLSIFWVALFGGIAGTFFYTRALSYIQYINFSVVVLLQKLQPLFAIILARVVLQERFRGRFYLWAILAIAGGYLVTFPQGIPVIVDGGKNLIAGALALGAAFAWGSSTVMGKYSLRDLDTRVITPLRLGLTAAITGLYLISTWQISAFGEFSGKQMIMVVAIVFSSGTVALSIYYFGLKQVEASRSTVLEMFWPVSAVTIDWVFFDHALSPGQILGAILLLFAIYRVTRRSDRD